ncbi:MAG: hypothetical protein WD577_11335 [Bacteroidales bacterium]
MKTLLQIFLLVCFLPINNFSQNLKEELKAIRFEHLRINVPDKEATAKWYVDNVGLEIISSSDEEVIYLRDLYI